VVRGWVDDAADAVIRDHDGTIGTARRAARAYAHRAKGKNTRRAYRAGARAWCAAHALPCLPAQAADVTAFLAAERGRGAGVNTVGLRRAAIRYLHFIAGCPVPTAQAQVAETMAGIHRTAADQGALPAKKLAATAEILCQILAPIGDDLVGLRDRALLLVGFAGALRRSELAAIRVEHLEARERGMRLTLPRSKGDRTGSGVPVAFPYGTTDLCPVRALRRWQDTAGIADGAVFRRIWRPLSRRAPAESLLPSPVVGHTAIDAGTVARIVKARAAAAGFDPRALGGHSLKRGALTTGMDGPWRAPDPPQAARPAQELCRARRVPRARRSVRQSPAQRRALAAVSITQSGVRCAPIGGSGVGDQQVAGAVMAELERAVAKIRGVEQQRRVAGSAGDLQQPRCLGVGHRRPSRGDVL
jgi:integrase